MIPYAQEKYILDAAVRLVAIEVKEFKQAKRFFFLYEYFNTYSSKRLVLDYIYSTKTILTVDWSDVRNSWRYANVEWTEVENDVSILAYFPEIYLKQNIYD